MIVLDTNQLDRHSLDSPLVAILRVLARLTNHKLALSEVTYNEHCAHYENRLRRAYVRTAEARDELAGLLKAVGVPNEGRNLESRDRASDRIKAISLKVSSQSLTNI